jgi:gliding motility-associated-like protein
MPLLRFCFIISVLLLLCKEQAVAQLAASRFSNNPSSSVDPLNARQMDSLDKLNYLGFRRNSTSSLQVVSGAKFKNGVPSSTRVSRVPFPAGRPLTSQKTNSVCYTISGREFLVLDSLVLYSGDPTMTADGNVLVSGETYHWPQISMGGFCMKTDIYGNVIWARIYDSVNASVPLYTNFFKSLELNDGSILWVGRTDNRKSGNQDLVFLKTDNAGNNLWVKTYASRLWQGFNGSGDYFYLTGLNQDSQTGDVYFTGAHWGGMCAITKLDPSDGHIIWSNGYHTYNTNRAFGLVINSSNLYLLQLGNGYYNDSYIDAIAVNKTTGDTLFTRGYVQTGDSYAPRLYSVYGMTQTNNGHFLLTGPTTGYFEYPVYTGTVDLHHAGVIELDENLGFVKAYGFKSRVPGNSYNTRVSVFPDGTGFFTMLKYLTPYNGEEHISLFKDDKIFHQRNRLHLNEGLPYEPASLKLSDGGFLDIKMAGDSTKLASDGSRLDYYRIHTSDTPSMCLGLKDSATSLWYFNFQEHKVYMDSVYRNLFTESLPKSYNSWSFAAAPEPACQVTSHCDTLALESSAAIVCPGTSVILTIHKNKECGGLVPLIYDTTWVSHVRPLNDSSLSFTFDKPGTGYIHGSLLGCRLRQDSVLIQVLPARNSLELGSDTVICPGNSIQLHGGKGFATYAWQDGSADSVYTVTSPGTYYLTTTNSCGGIYSDTVRVQPHAPIPLDLGIDRNKCNSDTLHLNAPAGFLNYQWSNDYNISSTTAQNVIVNPLTDTAYYIQAEKTPGCFAYDTVRIHVNTSPPINLGADRSFCSGDSAVFDAGSGFDQYTWSNGGNSRQMSVRTAGLYSVVALTAEGCKSYDTVRVVNVFSKPVVSLDQTGFLCFGNSRVLDAGIFASYAWNDGTTSQKLTARGIGTYAVQVTDNHGCRGGDTTRITAILPLPSGFLPPDTLLCSYDKIFITALRPYKSYQWSNGASASSLNISQPGTYWLQVKDENGCEGRDTIIINPKDCMKGCHVPTAFSPNSDGRNDLFRPMLFGHVKKYHFIVYSRWGQVIFETTELNRAWDGTVAGTLQQSNVFTWMCTYQFEGEEMKTEKGTVMLVR